jgi:hypothetical protein
MNEGSQRASKNFVHGPAGWSYLLCPSPADLCRMTLVVFEKTGALFWGAKGEFGAQPCKASSVLCLLESWPELSAPGRFFSGSDVSRVDPSTRMSVVEVVLFSSEETFT